MLAMMKLHLKHGVLDQQSAAAISGAIQYQQERCSKVVSLSTGKQEREGGKEGRGEGGGREGNRSRSLEIPSARSN